MRLIDATVLTEQIQKLWPNEYMVNWLGVLIDTQPTVKVEPIEVPKPVKHGKWDKGTDSYWHICEVCGAEVDMSMGTGVFVEGVELCEFKYCPNCGARMDE